MSFNFTTVLPNGNYRLDYSESFRKIESLWTGGRNLTLLNEIKHEILELDFESELEKEIEDPSQREFVPKIEGWKFVNLT